jgi:hypothetical protein
LEQKVAPATAKAAAAPPLALTSPAATP